MVRQVADACAGPLVKMAAAMAAAMAVQTANVFISGVTAREVNRANQAMV
jgi:hypothetical protein